MRVTETGLRILGAIIGGGASRRFGRDKAAEQVDGQALIEGVRAALENQVDEVVICGRNWSTLEQLNDRPSPDLGPLGGINAALHYAADEGFDGVLCMPVDVYPAPTNVAALLAGQRLTVFEKQHLIGFWPVNLADTLEAYLLTGQRKVHGFLNQMDARRVTDPPGLTNVNWLADLEKLKTS